MFITGNRADFRVYFFATLHPVAKIKLAKIKIKPSESKWQKI